MSQAYVSRIDEMLTLARKVSWLLHRHGIERTTAQVVRYMWDKSCSCNGNRVSSEGKHLKRVVNGLRAVLEDEECLKWMMKEMVAAYTLCL